jgi:uncharacterized protein (DUF1697 family)
MAKAKSKTASPVKKARGARTHVALLRGINLGPHNKLPMPELVELFEASGCTSVATYIQSGNVVFSASPAVAKKVAVSVSRAIAERFGHEVPLVIRTAAELAAAATKNPLLGPKVDTTRHTRGVPQREAQRKGRGRARPKRSPPDVFVVQGSEIFLLLPNGVAPSKLTNAYFDSKLRVVSTIRNWRTVLTLAEMLKG